MNAEFVSMALKMLVALSVVLASFWGVLLLVKKFSVKNGWLKNAGKNKPIEVLSYQGLGPNKAVYLLRCCDHKLLVGVTNNSVNLVSEIQDLDDELLTDSTDVKQNTQKHKEFKSNLRERLPVGETSRGQNEFKDRLGEISRV